jgi:hypothetical protein
MKKNYLKNSIYLALFLSTGLANAQTFVPDKAIVTSINFSNKQLIDYSYNESGFLVKEETSEIIPESEDTILVWYKTYVRDQLGRMLEETTYNRNSNSFYIQQKNIFRFDPSNHSLDQYEADVQKRYGYNPNTSVLELTGADSTAKTFSGDKLTRIKGYRKSQSQPQWVLSYEESYTYNTEGQSTSKTYFEYDENGVVEEGEKLEFNFIQAQAKQYKYINNSWIPVVIFKDVLFEEENPDLVNREIEPYQYTGYKLNPDGSETSEIVAKQIAPVQSGDTSIVESWEMEESGLVKERDKIIKNDTSTVRINEQLINNLWKVVNVETEFSDEKGEYAGYANSAIEDGKIVHKSGNYFKRVYNDKGALVSETTISFNNGVATPTRTIVYSGFTEVITATETPKAVTLNFWPNPATDYLTLSEASDYVIFDFNGTVIDSGKAASVIDVSGLNPSMYFIKTGNAAPVKFVKE